MKKSPAISLPCSIIVFFLIISSSSSSTDTIHPSMGMADGETLVSTGRTFVLGFFSPNGSTKRYLGIWFSVSAETVVWVANRDRPLYDATGVLRIDGTGNLVLTGNSGTIFWSTRQISSANTAAQLLDSGNFVLREENSPTAGTFLWQSFDYPTDTFLPGMKIGHDSSVGRRWTLTSWKKESDPAQGEHSFCMDPRGRPQPFLLTNSTPIYRSGPWNGFRFSGNQVMESYQNYIFNFVQNPEAAYYDYTVTSPSVLTRLVAEHSGNIRRFQWDSASSNWLKFRGAPEDNVCDKYAYCGPNGVCNADASVVCRCFGGFRVKHQDEWNNKIWNGGCVRKTNLSCGNDDGFLQVKGVKLPDTVNSTVNTELNLHQCREACSKNCSCVAFASADIGSGESGCLTWVGDLIDTRTFTDYGQEIFIRLAKVDLAEILQETPKAKRKVIIGATLAAASVCAFSICCGYAMWRKRKRNFKTTTFMDETDDLPLFDLETIVLATGNFAETSKIGSGGFGEVYKGKLRDGTEVAVKRQTSRAGVGIDVFATEVRLIAKLQHRNLVRLLGCCIDGDERLLVYEYMPNGSLDSFIFGDEQRRRLLNWERRLDIILGVARGLVYLHQDSRLRVIHRDLKAANVLLDEAMSPKISDFGTARVFHREQMEEKTIKIVGTFGYMSPEYLLNGRFSEKSDVFSFGVLVLEIISGRKNPSISRENQRIQLLAKAWTMHADGDGEKLLDTTLEPPSQLSDILRFMQVGLLCVQESPADRPTMQHVAHMLANKCSVPPPPPKKPGFFMLTGMTSASREVSEGLDSSPSVSGFTVTNLEGR